MADELDNARKSLERMQTFDVAGLPREAQLGQDMNFKEAVEPANRLINLFRQYPHQFLDDLPPNQLTAIKNSADANFNLLSEVLKFDAKEPDAYNRRTNLIQQLRDRYQPTFNEIFPLISYGATRQRDFDALERNFRASMQRAEDSAQELMKKLEEQQTDAQKILNEIRKVAAEQGVSQQAVYFRDDSNDHKQESDKWRKYTVRTAIALGVYAIATMFLHKLPWIAPSSTYDSIQLAVSKVLIFAVLGYMVLLCARNFLSHKHNEIVNKHRQNALLTFKALVDAGQKAENRDVVLTYAAACIFSPQDTGYTKSAEGGKGETLNIIQALPKLVGGKSE